MMICCNFFDFPPSVTPTSERRRPRGVKMDETEVKLFFPSIIFQVRDHKGENKHDIYLYEEDIKEDRCQANSNKMTPRFIS